MIDLRLGDCLDILPSFAANSLDALVTDPPAGIKFMGVEWDHDHGGREGWVKAFAAIFAECYRTLKPWAHALVWALPRTSHWTATALEEAGFEIRDVVNHLFGQGFPKSLDVSKAIDKAAGMEREVTGLNQYATRSSEFDLGRMNDDGWQPSARMDTAPATDDAKEWDGWGTGLKPACEHWILCRKPLSEKTVAANVLKWGTGAINIDGCRISVEGEPWDWDGTRFGESSMPQFGGHQTRPYVTSAIENGMPTKISHPNPQGRFPSNVILSCTCGGNGHHDDDCIVAMLDKQSGVLPIGGENIHRKGKNGYHGGWGESFGHFDKRAGGASRFFYVAKASRSERGEDNKHPTVKSIALMRYLCRLITPPNGIILDCFMGSGTTGIAAIAEGFHFVGIEREANYFEIAKRRIAASQTPMQL